MIGTMEMTIAVTCSEKLVTPAVAEALFATAMESSGVLLLLITSIIRKVSVRKFSDCTK